MSRKTLDEWLDHYASGTSGDIHLGLDRVQAVAHALGLLPLSMPSIIVAGTNGKGSTVSMLESVYHHAGYRVGALTSPHLWRYNERIRINTLPLPDEALIEAFEAVHSACTGTFISYFEVNVLIALWSFCQQNVDIVVLEVGLGGRLDATNIIDADVSIITSVGMDHMCFLGPTIEDIAYEKSGVMRSNTPSVIGERRHQDLLLHWASEHQAEAYTIDKDFISQPRAADWRWKYKDHDHLLPMPYIMDSNAACALMAVHLLNNKCFVSTDNFPQAIEACQPIGRCQHIEHVGQWVVDVAHNPHAVQALIHHHARLGKPEGRTYALFSGMQDKALSDMLAMIIPHVDKLYSGPLDVERSVSFSELNELLQDTQAKVCSSFEKAYDAICEIITPKDRVIAFGSFYVVSYVLGNVHSGANGLN